MDALLALLSRPDTAFSLTPLQLKSSSFLETLVYNKGATTEPRVSIATKLIIDEALNQVRVVDTSHEKLASVIETLRLQMNAYLGQFEVDGGRMIRVNRDVAGQSNETSSGCPDLMWLPQSQVERLAQRFVDLDEILPLSVFNIKVIRGFAGGDFHRAHSRVDEAFTQGACRLAWIIDPLHKKMVVYSKELYTDSKYSIEWDFSWRTLTGGTLFPGLSISPKVFDEAFVNLTGITVIPPLARMRLNSSGQSSSTDVPLLVQSSDVSSAPTTLESASLTGQTASASMDLSATPLILQQSSTKKQRHPLATCHTMEEDQSVGPVDSDTPNDYAEEVTVTMEINPDFETPMESVEPVVTATSAEVNTEPAPQTVKSKYPLLGLSGMVMAAYMEQSWQENAAAKHLTPPITPPVQEENPEPADPLVSPTDVTADADITELLIQVPKTEALSNDDVFAMEISAPINEPATEPVALPVQEIEQPHFKPRPAPQIKPFKLNIRNRFEVLEKDLDELVPAHRCVKKDTVQTESSSKIETQTMDTAITDVCTHGSDIKDVSNGNVVSMEISLPIQEQIPDPVNQQVQETKQQPVKIHFATQIKPFKIETQNRFDVLQSDMEELVPAPQHDEETSEAGSSSSLTSFAIESGRPAPVHNKASTPSQDDTAQAGPSASFASLTTRVNRTDTRLADTAVDRRDPLPNMTSRTSFDPPAGPSSSRITVAHGHTGSGAVRGNSAPYRVRR